MSDRLGGGPEPYKSESSSSGCLKALLTLFLIVFMLGFGLLGLCSMLGSTSEDHMMRMVGLLGVIAMIALIVMLWKR